MLTGDLADSLYQTGKERRQEDRTFRVKASGRTSAWNPQRRSLSNAPAFRETTRRSLWSMLQKNQYSAPDRLSNT